MNVEASPPRWWIVADDLTGAADAAAPFAVRGQPTVVRLTDTASPAPADNDHYQPTVVAVSTRSRSARPEVVRIATTAAFVRSRACDRWYLKIDSTLRGRPGAAIAGAFDAGATAAIVCPAFPAQGRTYREGTLFLHGERQVGLSIDVVTRRDLGTLSDISFANASSDAELDEVAAMGHKVISRASYGGATGACDRLVLVGSGGLASAIARRWPHELEGTSGSAYVRDHHRRRDISSIDSGVTVIAVGTRHKTTWRQLEYLRSRSNEDTGEKIAIFSTSGTGAERNTLNTLARDVEARCRNGGVVALVLTGGDTAHAVLERLGTHEIRLEGECEPGVPFGIVQGGVAHGIAVVLKSGGFGDDSTLWAAVQYLRGSSS